MSQSFVEDAAKEWLPSAARIRNLKMAKIYYMEKGKTDKDERPPVPSGESKTCCGDHFTSGKTRGCRPSSVSAETVLLLLRLQKWTFSMKSNKNRAFLIFRNYQKFEMVGFL